MIFLARLTFRAEGGILTRNLSSKLPKGLNTDLLLATLNGGLLRLDPSRWKLRTLFQFAS